MNWGYVQSVTEEKLSECFTIARELFKSGELNTSKKLIDLFVERVTVYDDHSKLMIKIKPDLSFKDKSGHSSGESCPLDGAEGTKQPKGTQFLI